MKLIMCVISSLSLLSFFDIIKKFNERDQNTGNTQTELKWLKNVENRTWFSWFCRNRLIAFSEKDSCGTLGWMDLLDSGGWDN